jgi:STE24 endopeptidase
MVGGFRYLDHFVNSLTNNGILNGIIFVIAVIGFRFVIDIPFDIYKIFFIEERFGNNRNTFKNYILDLIKALPINFILFIPSLTIFLYCFQIIGLYAWWQIWIYIATILFLLQIVAPTIILPVFFKVKNIGDLNIIGSLEDLCDATGISVSKIVSIDSSKRNLKANAFFAGILGSKSIVLYDTIIELLSIDELKAVLAHEIGHYKNKHIIINFSLELIFVGIFLYSYMYFLSDNRILNAFYVYNFSYATYLVLFYIFFSSFSPIYTLVSNLINRKMEYAADKYSSIYAGNENLISALKKLAINRLYSSAYHPIHSFLYSSHPSIEQRIDALDKKE